MSVRRTFLAPYMAATVPSGPILRIQGDYLRVRLLSFQTVGFSSSKFLESGQDYPLGMGFLNTFTQD